MAFDDYRDLIKLGIPTDSGVFVETSAVAAPAVLRVEQGGPTPDSFSVVWETGDPATYQAIQADFELVGFAKKFAFTPIGSGTAENYRFTAFDCAALAPSLYQASATLERFYGTT